jgi:four helix bundle protein
MADFRTYDLSIQFSRLCRNLNLPQDLQYQLNRASASIALNLKEGSARHTEKDRHRFYRMAMGSFRECEAVFDIQEIKNGFIIEKANHLGRSLNRLCKSTSKT